MLWVVTFSVFLPSLTSSSVVCVHPGAAQKTSEITPSQIRFMIGLPLLCQQGDIVLQIVLVINSHVKALQTRAKAHTKATGDEGSEPSSPSFPLMANLS